MSDADHDLYDSPFGQLLLTGQRTRVLDIFEQQLGLEPGDYRDPQKLAERIQSHREQSTDPLDEIAYLPLFSILSSLNRQHDSLRLLGAFLGLAPDELDDSEKIVSRIGDLAFAEIPLLRFFCTTAAATGLTSSHPETGRKLLESLVGLEEEDYSDPRHCARRLEESFLGFPIEPPVSWMVLLTSCLKSLDRSAEALTLFKADLGWMEAGALERHPECLVGLLRGRLRGVSPDGAGTYTRGLANILTDTGRAAQAVPVLEFYAGLETADYQQPAKLSESLRRFFDGMNDTTEAAFASQLLSALLESGELDKARVLVARYVEDFALTPQRSTWDQPAHPDLTLLIDEWLRLFGRETGGRALEICRRATGQFHRSLDIVSELEDRQGFIRSLGDLRRRVIAVGHHHAGLEPDPDLAKKLWWEVLSWDAELSQRLLFEKFLLGEWHLAPAGEPPEQKWPLPAALRPEWESHLPPREESAGKVGGFLSLPEHAASSPRAQAQPDGQVSVFRRVAAEQPILEEKTLAASLGASTLLFRATFTLSGRLLWNLWASDGERLELRAHGSGREDDLARLRWAIARHDLALELASEHDPTKGRRRGRFSKDLEQLEHRFELLITTFRTESEGSTEESRELLDQFEKIFKPMKRQMADIWVGLQTHLEKNLRNYRQISDVGNLPRLLWNPIFASRPEDDEKRAAWAAECASQVAACARLVRRIVNREEQLEEVLDAITSEFIEEVHGIWNLDDLELPPEHDVVLQVDDLLHAVPLAFLPVGGRSLYQQVLSIRSSVGLKLDVFQTVQEKSPFTPLPDRRLLSLSHFDPGDPALRGIAALHHGFEQLGRAFGFEAWAAADDPPGTAGTLRAALGDHRGFEVVAICGHGHATRGGITLGSDDPEVTSFLWRGAGCDLSGVGWLWLVSCSIGRVEAGGDYDVEGFTIELALHRARSVAAFRWPISALEAVAFTNEAVSNYLGTAGGEDGKTLSPCRRARALNAARKAFLGDGENPPRLDQASLHTIAACELYGLG